MKIHHFADGTNLLYDSSSLKDINKKINFDLSNLVQWLQANKIALNSNKTDIIIFRSPRKQIIKKMNFRLNGQKIRQKSCTKYLGVLIDEHLLFKDHINFLKQELNSTNGILVKLRHHLPSDILKTVYYSLFDTHLRYACQVWGQSNSDILVMVQRAQNKVLRIINFKEEWHPSAPLYTETEILNLTNIITLNNYMLVFDHLNSSLPAIFDDLFKAFKEQHSHNTRRARRYVLNIPKMKTSSYGSRSVQVKSIKDWNDIIDKIHFTPEDLMKRFEVIQKIKNTLL